LSRTTQQHPAKSSSHSHVFRTRVPHLVADSAKVAFAPKDEGAEHIAPRAGTTMLL